MDEGLQVGYLVVGDVQMVDGVVKNGLAVDKSQHVLSLCLDCNRPDKFYRDEEGHVFYLDGTNKFTTTSVNSTVQLTTGSKERLPDCWLDPADGVTTDPRSECCGAQDEKTKISFVDVEIMQTGHLRSESGRVYVEDGNELRLTHKKDGKGHENSSRFCRDTKDCVFYEKDNKRYYVTNENDSVVLRPRQQTFVQCWFDKSKIVATKPQGNYSLLASFLPSWLVNTPENNEIHFKQNREMVIVQAGGMSLGIPAKTKTCSSWSLIAIMTVILLGGVYYIYQHFSGTNPQQIIVYVVPYGVLDQAPSVQTAIVDPAGLYFIQKNRPDQAGGASGAIYKKLGISEAGGFGPDVTDGITETSDAKSVFYQDHFDVIHVAAPKLAEVENQAAACKKLIASYTNVFKAFASNAETRNLVELRMLPISGGIFAGGYLADLPTMTATAVDQALSDLSGDPVIDILQRTKVKMCIYNEVEVDDYKKAFARRGDQGVHSCHMQRDTMTEAAFVDPTLQQTVAFYRG